MKSRFVETAGVIFFFVFLSLPVFAQNPTSVRMPELSDLQGRKLRLADYKGKVVLINFWATWCPPCRTEVPELIKWQREYGDRGLQIVGITYPPQTRSEVRRFSLKAGINYPVALGTKATKSLLTASEALPTTVVVNAEGKVQEVIEGIVFPDEFDAKIKPLLIHQSGAIPTRPTRPKRPAIQKARIVVNAEGFKLTNLTLRRGVKARLTFIRTAEGCGTEIVIPAYGINRPLPLHVPVVVSFTPSKSGRVKLTCGMDMFRGWLVVK